MTKEITKAIILQEIQDKFKMREFEPEIFLFSETVVPTYDVGQHAKHPKIEWMTISITSTGLKTIFTVPQNEKWHLSRYDVIFMGAGAYTIAGTLIIRVDGYPDSVYLDLTAGQSASYHNELPTILTLFPGDKLGVNVDGYTSTQDLRLYIDYMVEEIR